MMDVAIPTVMACTAVLAAARSFFSPNRRATMAVVDMLSPMAIA
jgi:hypothetical protein